MSDPSRPNILVIHVDQQRIDTLGAYGNREIKTPYVDAIAADGVRFANSFCPFPVCTPSRYSLLCGRYVHEHRGWNNHSTLPAGTPTFASIMREAGYRTKAVGKMHFTPTYSDVGFDEMLLSEQHGPGRWDDDYHRRLRELGLVDRIDLWDQVADYRKTAPPEYWANWGAMQSNLLEEHHTTSWIGDQAVREVESWTGSGNLLMVGFVKPHHPFDPPWPWSEMYEPDEVSILPGWTDAVPDHDLALADGYFPNANLTPEAMRRVTAFYYATITQIDYHVGRLTESLKCHNLYNDTLIVYTSDHGDFMGQHHMMLKGNHMYDSLVKVPLIVKYPGNAHAGRIAASLVSNLDVAPTLLAQAGLAPAPGMHGTDLHADPKGRDMVFAEDGPGRQIMARSATRKLIVHQAKGTKLFFDLQNDPYETRDLSASAAHADEIAHYEQALAEWLGPDPLPGIHLDEYAPVIDQPNVPSRDLSHRPDIMAYYERKMGEGE